MNGFLGLASGAATLLLSQPAPLVIGSLVLQGYEVPSRITIGGSQSITMHKLPGGGRIIDAMGPDDGTIAWRGLFVGPDAAQRARILDSMRSQGTPQLLGFADYTLNVIIVHFEYDYQDRGALVSYRIRTEAVPDAANQADTVSGLDLVLQDDLEISKTLLTSAAAAALTYATLANKADAAEITASAFGLNTIAAGIGATAVTAAATTLSDLPSNEVVQAGLQTAGVSAQGGIQGVSTLSSTSIAGFRFTSTSGLAASTAQAAVLAALVQAGGYINRANTNLASFSGQILAPLVHT